LPAACAYAGAMPAIHRSTFAGNEVILFSLQCWRNIKPAASRAVKASPQYFIFVERFATSISYKVNLSIVLFIPMDIKNFAEPCASEFVGAFFDHYINETNEIENEDHWLAQKGTLALKLSWPVNKLSMFNPLCANSPKLSRQILSYRDRLFLILLLYAQKNIKEITRSSMIVINNIHQSVTLLMLVLFISINKGCVGECSLRTLFLMTEATSKISCCS
jgi:hypothetical protein